MKHVLASLLLTLPAYAAGGGEYHDGQGPAPDVTMEVTTSGALLQAAWSVDGGLNWSGWVTVTPNPAGTAGDVWEAPIHDTNGAGEVKVEDGRVKWRQGPGHAWKKLRRKHNPANECGDDDAGSRLGGSRSGPPRTVPSNSTVGTLPYAQPDKLPGPYGQHGRDEIH